MSMVKRRAVPKAKRYAEGGPVKSKFNDTDWAMSMISPAYALSQVVSGNAKWSDLGLMGVMKGRFSGDKDEPLTPEEEAARKQQALAAPAAPAAAMAPLATAAPGAVRAYRKGGPVKAAPRGNGKAKTGIRRGKMR